MKYEIGVEPETGGPGRSSCIFYLFCQLAFWNRKEITCAIKKKQCANLTVNVIVVYYYDEDVRYGCGQRRDK